MKKKALIALTSAFSVFLIGTIGLSLAWFTTAKMVILNRNLLIN